MISLVAAGAALLLSTGTVLAAPATTIESGAYTAYTAPDAGAATDGSITFGFLGTPETIAADAAISPAAAAWLPNISGGVPTCISVTRDGGTITALDFVAQCTVSGTLTLVPDVFGAGVDAYALSDRVITPVYQIRDESSPDFNAGYNALMATAFDAGATLHITFNVDTSTGIPGSMNASTQIAGAVSVEDDGDIKVGAATVLDQVLDPTTRAALEAAAADGISATVDISGSGAIDVTGGPVVITLSFTVTPDAAVTSPTPTATPTPSQSTAPTSSSTAMPLATNALLPDTAISGPGTDASTFAQALVLLAALALLGAVVAVHGSRRN